MSDVSYKQAIEIIKSGIDSSKNLSEEGRGNIAESLLEIENPQSSKQLEKISLSFGPEQKDRLEAYLSQLEDVRQSNIDQKVREGIQRARRLSDLRNELKTRIHSAMGEAKELEQIANKLQDDNLGNIAGKEEHEIKHLGEKLQQIHSKAEEVEQLEQKISSALGQLGGRSIKESIEIKERAVSQILQESSTKNGSPDSSQGVSHDFDYNWEEDPNKLYDWDAIQNLSHQNQRSLDQIKDWKRILDKPKAYINMNTKIESLSNRSLSRYDISNEKSTFSYPKNEPNTDLPNQGFKFHITAYPDEGFEVCRELIPIIQKLGYQHKIHTDIQSMSKFLDNNGEFHSVQGMKLMTIYPGVTSNAPDQQDFVPGDPDHNKKRLFINKERTVFLLEKLLELADDDILEGGPQLEGSRSFYSYLDSDVDVKEYRVGSTRVHLTYSFLGSMSRYIDTGGKNITLKDWVRKTDKNGNYIKNGKRTFENSDKFRENGKNMNYFLSHLVSRQMSDDLKEHLTIDTSDKRAGSAYFNYAILGRDGKIAGAYYLPPPECIEEIKKMMSNI